MTVGWLVGWLVGFGVLLSRETNDSAPTLTTIVALLATGDALY
jgi:hypothetical protein